ncbi:MAG: SLC13 family permease [Gammaproteobacteria bacterium]
MIAAPALTPEMCCVFGLLALSVYLFVSEIVRVDVAAILVMLALGLLATVPGLDSIVRIADLFNGFASNTVFAVGAMMIMGAGLDKTGLMGGVANLILRVGGGSERRLIAAVAASAGLVSAVIQNSAVIVLFLPVVARLAARSGVPVTRLLMPMAFCVILGGTMTLVGSSPLILLNDLVRNSNAMLVPAQRIAEFTLFSVTPIGLALLATGVAYFVYAGRYVLPIAKTEAITWGGRTAEYFRRVYGLEADIFEVRVLGHSRLVGRRIDVVERASRVRIIAYYSRGENLVAPAGTRAIEGGAMLGVMARPEAMKNFLEHFALEARHT